jgi:hypothetical protein
MKQVIQRGDYKLQEHQEKVEVKGSFIAFGKCKPVNTVAHDRVNQIDTT